MEGGAVSLKRDGGMGWCAYGEKAEGDGADELGY